MTDNVVPWRGITKLPLNVGMVLDNTPRDMQEVIILGYDSEGGFYFASSEADGGSVLWLLEKAKKYLLEVGEETDD